MPPRATPPAPGKSRRRPTPPTSGAWIRLVIGLAVVAMLVLSSLHDSADVPYSYFVKLARKYPDSISKPSLGTNARIARELTKDPKLPADTKEEATLKEKFEKKKTKHFVTKRWPLHDPAFTSELGAMIQKQGIEVEVP